MKISRNTFIISCCLGCIVLTLFLKSSVYDITNPQWYPASSSLNSAKTEGQEIIVHFHERRPFYTLYKGEPRGVVATPISRAFSYADIPFKWQETPATRQLKIIRLNESKTCAAGWFKTTEREQFSRFSLPVYQDNPFVAITRADNERINNQETVDFILKDRRLVLLVKESYSYGDYLDSKIEQINPRTITTTVDTQAMLKMLHSFRADYFFVTEEEAKEHLLYSSLKKGDFKLVTFSDIPKGNKRYLICSKQVEEDVMKRLNRAINYLVKLEDDFQ